MYFIAETKWDKEKGNLSEDEIIKINCAKKHFEAVDKSVSEIVKYAWVNSYKNPTMQQSFPQVFIDENYDDTLPLERSFG